MDHALHIDSAHRGATALGAVPRTMLIPLWARAAETRKARPLVRDARALQICESIDYDFDTFRWAFGTQIGCVLRGMLYDRWVAEFLVQHPTGAVVELGAGLTTRYERLDNGRACWVDIDLPDAMALRSRHVIASSRRVLLSTSVLDGDWPALVRRASPGPYYFVSEGMLMYLEPAAVRALLRRMADEFAGAELAFDSISPAVVKHQRLHDSMRHMMDAPFRWGVEDVHEIERWDRRLRIHEVATLPEIASFFSQHVPLRHRLVGQLVRRVLPGLAGAYRVGRLTLGSGSVSSRDSWTAR
jgi:O-methyltransferase involved in polyketide biosynthesis